MKIPEKAPEKKVITEIKPALQPETVPETSVKTTKPLSRQGISSGFSINSFLNKEEIEVKEEIAAVKTENLPQNHFTETDLQMEWNLMLKQLQTRNSFIFNAVKTFKLIKTGENTIKVLYPSDSAKVEFDKIAGEFFNHFKTKVHNHAIVIDYQRDFDNLKIEVLTKRKVFEKFIEKNPLLKDLDDLMKFDLT
jgi:DNA polymerase-3 subunit gamma/tau